MKKKDLQLHHIVEDRDGEKKVWETRDPKDYTEDLLDAELDTGYDIMKVYEFNKCVWDRDNDMDEKEKDSIISLGQPLAEYIKEHYGDGFEVVIDANKIEFVLKEGAILDIEH